MTARTCGASYKRTLRRRFRRWSYDGGAHLRARGGGCDGNSRKARVVNNYAGVLYMQGACIFMQGVVMECMVRLVRLRVGGNFFHTLEPKTFFVGSVFVLTSFIGFVTTIKNIVVTAFHKNHYHKIPSNISVLTANASPSCIVSG